jgi:hypothetical protein
MRPGVIRLLYSRDNSSNALPFVLLPGDNEKEITSTPFLDFYVLYFFQVFAQIGNFARHLQTTYQERMKNTHDDPARRPESGP